MKKLFVATILLFSLTSCFSYQQSGVSLTPYNYSQLHGWEDRNIIKGFTAFRKTCLAINSSKINSTKVFSENKNVWQNKCYQANTARSAKFFFESNFRPYLVSYNGKAKGKFTGYFEKEIEASLRRDLVYRYPIYRTPSDPRLLNLTRREIENGALKNKGLEIAYAKSAAKLFFLHIQGSGILKLPNGKRQEVGFNAKNNQQYTGIGAYMKDNGLVEHGTADEIIAWLEKNPIQARSIMNMNARYVFFSIKNGGPFGSLGVELTDQASLAVDPMYIPLGVPLWLQTTLPETKQYFTRLMNAQDTGSAIKGPVRGDIFFGEGAWASRTASGMKNDGNYFMLLPKEINPYDYFSR